jgi:hypothetical protein
LLIFAVRAAHPLEDHSRPSQDDLLGRIARAKSLTELESLNVSAPKNFVYRAIYAARYSQLHGTNPDRLILLSLPKNGSEMEQLYDAQDTAKGQDMAVSSLFFKYYEAVAKAVTRNPKYLPHFLRMIHSFDEVDNVDEWPDLCGLASKIYVEKPREYMSAAASLEPKYRKEAFDCRVAPDAP